jgi:hypothetical protein
MNNDVVEFFSTSDFMEHEVLRPLSHIRANWELMLDHQTGRYIDEEDSFAWLFSYLVNELAISIPPEAYHNSEDRLGEEVQQRLKWKIRKHGGIWRNEDGIRLHPSDYLAMLEQGGFKVDGVEELIIAAAGRIRAAIDRGQTHFDDMERGHQVILAGVLAAILYHMEPYEEEYRKNSLKTGY